MVAVMVEVATMGATVAMEVMEETMEKMEEMEVATVAKEVVAVTK